MENEKGTLTITIIGGLIVLLIMNFIEVVMLSIDSPVQVKSLVFKLISFSILALIISFLGYRLAYFKKVWGRRLK